MRIAQVAPLAESVPPQLYGGTERVVARLVDELGSLGHEVTLFARGDSKTSAQLHAVWPQGSAPWPSPDRPDGRPGSTDGSRGPARDRFRRHPCAYRLVAPAAPEQARRAFFDNLPRTHGLAGLS